MKVLICVLSSIVIFSFSSCPMPFEELFNMPCEEIIKHFTRGNRNARVTVGIIQDGEVSFTVYGENGKVMPNVEHVYQIASITKVLTAQLFARAVRENRVNLDDTIDLFLDLPANRHYPTIKQLLTHTSGFQRDYYHGQGTLTGGFIALYPYHGITERMVINTIREANIGDRDYPFKYSNFGIAVAGLVLEKIYNTDFTSLIHSYLYDLGMHNTKVGDGRGDLSNYWVADKGNPFIPSGALVSTITDMMMFAQMQIDGYPAYVNSLHSVFAYVDPPVEISGIEFYRHDAMGLGWHICTVNDLIYHAGDTGSFNSFLVFDKANRIAVVVLDNIRGYSRSAVAIGSAKIMELRR